jgi:hypothetical protein
MKKKNLLFSIMIVCVLPLNILARHQESSEWTLKIAVENAIVRLEPDERSPVAVTLLKDTTLESYEKTGEWFRVIIGPDESGFKVIGYIHSSEVEIIRVKTVREPDFWEEESETFQGIGLSIRFGGGPSHFFAGDINKGLDGIFGSWYDFFNSGGYTLDTRRSSFHTAADVSIDFIYQVKSQIGIGLGVGYIRSTTKNLLIVTGQDINVEQKFAGTPTIRSVPIRLGLYFTFPVHRLLSLSFNFGPALYLSKYTYLFGPDWKERQSVVQTAHARKLGFHGGLGIDVRLDQRVSFFIEGHGRYAKISDFEGEETRTWYPNSRETSLTENGTLYYLENGKNPSLAILSKEPAGFSLVRKGIFDLSGFGLRAGLTVKF